MLSCFIERTGLTQRTVTVISTSGSAPFYLQAQQGLLLPRRQLVRKLLLSLSHCNLTVPCFIERSGLPHWTVTAPRTSGGTMGLSRNGVLPERKARAHVLPPPARQEAYGSTWGTPRHTPQAHSTPQHTSTETLSLVPTPRTPGGPHVFAEPACQEACGLTWCTQGTPSPHKHRHPVAVASPLHTPTDPLLRGTITAAPQTHGAPGGAPGAPQGCHRVGAVGGGRWVREPHNPSGEYLRECEGPGFRSWKR